METTTVDGSSLSDGVRCRYIRVASAGNAAMLALHAGMDAAEVGALLAATFPDPDERRAVALMDLARMLVVPLRAAAAAPELLRAASYTVLFGGKAQRIASIQQRQLFVAIGLLEEEGLHFNMAQMLRALVMRSDEMVMAAYEVFELDGNLAELKDTLLRVASIVNGDQTQQPYSDTQTTESWQSIFLDIAQVMLRDGEISEPGYNKLVELINANDPVIVAAYEIFLMEQDLGDLRDTLSRVAQMSKSQSQARDEKFQEYVREMQQVVSSLRLTSFPLTEISDVIQELALAAAENSRARGGVLQDIELLVLQMLLEKEHPYLQLAFEEFKFKTNDKALLTETLRALAIYYGISPPLREMESKGHITREDANLLEQLFAAGNPEMLAAWDVYVEEHDAEDLVDTLYRIIMHRAGTDRSGAGASSKEQLHHLVLQLHESGKLSDDQKTALLELVDGDDIGVFRVYGHFLKSADIVALVENLLRLAQDAVSQRESRFDPSSPLASEKAAVWKTIRRTINRLFLNNFLSSHERYVLLGLVNSRDSNVEATMNAFAKNHNQDVLVSQLRDLVASLDDENEPYVPSQAQKHLLELVETLLADRKIDSDMYLCLTELIEAEHPLILHAYSNYAKSLNIDTLLTDLLAVGVANVADAVGAGGGEFASSLFSREVRMESQIHSLVTSKKLDHLQGRLITKILKDQDARVLAAFDVFDELKDEDDLADTLQRIYARAIEEEKDRLDFGTKHMPHYRRHSIPDVDPVGIEDPLTGLKRQRSQKHEEQQAELQKSAKTKRKSGEPHEEDLPLDTSLTGQSKDISLLRVAAKERRLSFLGSDDGDEEGDATEDKEKLIEEDDLAPSITHGPPTRLKGKAKRQEDERKKGLHIVINDGASSRRKSSNLDAEDDISDEEMVRRRMETGAAVRRQSLNLDADDHVETDDMSHLEEPKVHVSSSSSSSPVKPDAQTRFSEEEKGTEVFKPVDSEQLIEMLAEELLREGATAKTVNTLKAMFKSGNKEILEALAIFREVDDLDLLKASLKQLASA